MADITMCQNENCKDKETCYRYKAPVSEYQSYFLIDGKFPNDRKECKHYWEYKSGKYKTIEEVTNEPRYKNKENDI